MTALDPRRLERHLRSAMRRQGTATRAGPFTCYLHEESADAALNAAMPEEPTEGRRVPVAEGTADATLHVPDDDPATGLVLLRAHFTSKQRLPRVEFVLEAHPELPALLASEGFVQDATTTLLACTRETWRQLDPPPGLRIEPVIEGSGWDTVRRYLEVQREAYAIELGIPEEGPQGFWPALGIGAGLLALVDDEPAGAAGITPASDGLADVRGLAVRPAYRRVGLGSFLLSGLARVAHETGVDALLATPDSEADLPLAARAGFVPVATLASWSA